MSMETVRSTGAAPRDAAVAAQRSGVVVRVLETVEDLGRAVELFNAVWGLKRGDKLVSLGLLRAMTHAGSYVSGAFDADGALVGGCFGFLGTPIGRGLHSHLAAVLASARGRGIGKALKLHQREWALGRGLDSITWTFDPLIAANAHLNMLVLGARCEEYLVNFYGEMPDSVNAGEETDRILLRWDLTREWGSSPSSPSSSSPSSVCDVLVCRDDEPMRLEADPAATLRRAQIPVDITKLRISQPQVAQHWRTALRDTLTDHLERGWQIVGFDSDRRYLLEKR